MPAPQEQGDDDTGDSSVKTIGRAAKLLNILAAGNLTGTMLTEIARSSGFGKGTTHRILSALIDVGFVVQDTETRLYRLGSRFGAIAHRGFVQNAAVLAQPIVERLADETGDTAYCSIREGLAAVCIGHALGSFPIRTLTLALGHRRPLGVGSGSLALLSSLPDAMVEDILVKNAAWYGQFPIFTPPEVRRMVAATRKRGYALIEGQVISGMNAIAVAVPAKDGLPILALSVAAIRERLEPPRRKEIVAILQKATEELSSIL